MVVNQLLELRGLFDVVGAVGAAERRLGLRFRQSNPGTRCHDGLERPGLVGHSLVDGKRCPRVIAFALRRSHRYS
jgi:hypothetical protein